MQFKTFLFLSLIFSSCLVSAQIHYQLDVQIEPAKQLLQGQIRLQADAATRLQLHLPAVQSLTLNGAAQKREQVVLDLALAARVPVQLTYSMKLENNGYNLITSEHVFLMDGNWYPQPQQSVQYQFSALLPATFAANSEADRIQVSQQGNQRLFAFDFPYPLERLTLNASSQYVYASETYKGIQIDSYFFQADKDLAKIYRDYTKTYLDMYIERLSPYPFKRFAIVMHQQPSGWSLPTYTLLGQRVARLPFIVKSSLGHEILHQWFGNFVWINYAAGNWAEGLVNYLADHYYQHLAGEGAAYRRQIMLDYAAYVDAAQAMRVLDFRTRNNKAQSAVGYGKVAMIFHHLHQHLGEETFILALRELLKNNAFKAVTWKDVQQSVEHISKQDLTAFFQQWLERKDIPHISVEHTQVKVAQGQLKLLFKLKQQTEKPYDLRLPLQIETSLGKRTEMLHLDKAEKSYSLALEALPSKIVLDGDYDVMRRLDDSETAAILAQVLAITSRLSANAQSATKEAEKNAQPSIKLILNQAIGETYQPLLDVLQLSTEQAVSFPNKAWEEEAQNLVIIGKPIPQLIGAQKIPQQGVMLKVFKHPYQADKRILWLYAENRAQAQMAARKIGHYGKYSSLQFVDGRNVQKDTALSQVGISVWQQDKTAAVQPVQTQDLSGILPQLKTAKVIYVGEQHDQFAHHINQLSVIRYLHEAGLKVAVGLEMFQQPYQQALDDYLADNLSEAEFLKQSQYFSKWRYDYNLYKPIIDYAKQKQLPLIALNIEGDISRQVGREGMPTLDDKARAQLPEALDFEPLQYREDLKAIFAMHQNASIPGMKTGAQHGHSVKPRFENFHQAQVLWDESMAEAAHEFLQQHPQHRLVILAGNGHVRYGYGIPERLKRRNGLDYISIVQDEIPAPNIAHYVLYPPPVAGEEAPRLGVFIDEKNGRLLVLQVEPHRPAANAKVEKGDLIVKLGGHAINHLADLKFALLDIGQGNSAELEVERDGKILQMDVEF